MAKLGWNLTAVRMKNGGIILANSEGEILVLSKADIRALIKFFDEKPAKGTNDA